MNRTQAFTLIELLVVIAIIAVLASVLIVGLRKTNERVNLSVARQCAQALLTKAAEYTSEHNTYEGFDGTGNQRPDSGCSPTPKVKIISFEVGEANEYFISGTVTIKSNPDVILPWDVNGIKQPLNP